MNTNESQAVEQFEELSAEDRFRSDWATVGADWSWQILRFLQGRRRNELSLAEIETTQLYARSTQREKDALRFVTAQVEQFQPLTEEESRQLVERDAFLVEFADGKTLGHADFVYEIRGIPFRVARAQALDAALFPRTFNAPTLFRWVWGR